MEQNDKYDIKLRWGLSLKKILDTNKMLNEEKKKNTGKRDKSIIDSFGKLEKESEITKSTLVNIVQGKINAATTTWAAILEALGLSLSKFALIHDGLTPDEINQHKSAIKVKKKNTATKNSKKKK
ncbi:MAG: hypothetical protein ABI675_17900 [Chitinophagaceae bacterium]